MKYVTRTIEKSLEQVGANDTYPMMVILETTDLEKVSDDKYIDKTTGITLYIKSNKYLIFEKDGFQYISINSYQSPEEDYNNFKEQNFISEGKIIINQRDNKIGFTLSRISEEELENGIIIEDQRIIDNFSEYDDYGQIVGFTTKKNGREVIIPVIHSGHHSSGINVESCEKTICKEIKSGMSKGLN